MRKGGDWCNGDDNMRVGYSSNLREVQVSFDLMDPVVVSSSLFS